MKGKLITVLNNEQIPTHLRELAMFEDTFPTNESEAPIVPVLVELSTEFNEDGEWLVYENLT